MDAWGKITFRTTALVGLLVGVAVLFGNVLFVHDDAYIMLRYARNFANGHGLVWNIG
ncbi:MAG: hypothetical protein ACI9OJ_002202, partial [Myxococcota bacterium]